MMFFQNLSFEVFNNQWYRKSIEYMQDTVGTKPSKWCAGCHDHAVFFNGMMDTPAREILDRPEAHVGLTCTSCHSIVAVNSSMGNGDFVIEYPPLHNLATSENFFLRNMHDFVVHLDPGPHRQTFLKPFFRAQTTEFCSSCHKVHLDVPVNDYRWFRGFNEYDGWQSSGVSGQGARSFYYPPKPMKCVDCHMPLVASQDKANIDGQVHSHRFPGANTALPVVNQDEEQLRTVVEFLQDDQVSIDSLIPPGAADTVHYRLTIPEDVGDKIHLTAKLNYRKFAWWNTQWAFAGIRDPNHHEPQIAAGYDDGRWIFAGDTSTVSGKLKEIPDLPIVTMATDEATLRVVRDDSKVAAEAGLDQEDLNRWNDYGIGLLLQGDLKAAELIFEKVTEVDPDYADGWVNIGRVRVREGRTDEAQEVLRRALELAPELAKAHYFLALTYKTQGQYDKALEHLETAASQYPRDRVVLNQLFFL